MSSSHLDSHVIRSSIGVGSTDMATFVGVELSEQQNNTCFRIEETFSAIRFRGSVMLFPIVASLLFELFCYPVITQI